jgi:uncharacterized HAD superfamily protein
MNIGVDLDGVTADIDTEMIRRLEEAGYETDINKWHSYFMEDNHPHVPEGFFEDQFNDPNLWLNARPYEDAWHMVNKWWGEGHNVFFITCRPKSVWEITYRWLDDWSIGFNDVYAGLEKYKKLELVEPLKLDLFIEDDPLEAAEIARITTSFLVDRPYNVRYNIGAAERVENFYKINEWIKDAEVQVSSMSKIY